MESVSATTSLNNTSWPSANLPSKAEGIAWCIALSFEAVLIVIGNLLIIVLFAANKKLRKKSLILVINMAFADLMLGAFSIPIYVFSTVNYYQIWTTKMPTSSSLFVLSSIVEKVFLQASVISAAFISGERFYAIFWPLKHRTLSMRPYRIPIFMVWILALLGFLVFAFQSFSSKIASYALLSYFFLLILIFCGCNIAIWRKFQQGSIGASHQQNKVSQIQRLTRTLLIVSIIALVAWLPSVAMYSLLNVFEVSVPWGTYLVAIALTSSNSFLNPILYALRIPEFREAFVLCCFRRKAAIDGKGSEGRDNKEAALTLVTRLRTPRTLRANPSLLQLAWKQDIMDTKL